MRGLRQIYLERDLEKDIRERERERFKSLKNIS